MPIVLEPAAAEGTEQRFVTEESVSGAGVGASFALNIVNDTENAAIGEGAVLKGTSNLALTAKTSDGMVTFAQNGTQGKAAITPTVAVAISNVTTKADVGPAGSHGEGAELQLSGNLEASATQTATVETKSRGNFESSSAGIGASIAITSANHEVLATTYRNLEVGGAITFTAVGTSDTNSETRSAGHGAKASGEGGPSGDVQEQAQGQLSQADKMAANNKAGGAMDKSAPAASTADSGGTEASSGDSTSIQAAAAITYNLVHAKVIASLPEGLKIAAGGLLTLSSASNTHATANADTEAEGSAKGAAIAASVGINRAYVNNEANISSGDLVISRGLLLSALMNPVTEEAGAEPNKTDAFATKAESGASESEDVNLAGSLALNIIDVNTSAQALGANSNTKRGPPVIDANSGDVTMTAESSVETKAEGRYEKHMFDPNEAGEIVGIPGSGISEHVFIRLPQELEAKNKPIETGDAVIYHDGGGSPIGIVGGLESLKDGEKYYVIVGRSGLCGARLQQGKRRKRHPAPARTEGRDRQRTQARSLRKRRQNRDRRLRRAEPRQRNHECRRRGRRGSKRSGKRRTQRHQHRQDRNRSKRWTQGKFAISPTIAVTIPNITTTASFGAGPSIAASGKITAIASQQDELESVARGQFSGGTVGVGISLSLTVPTYTVESTSARSLSAKNGEVALQALGSSTVTGITYASGEGETTKAEAKEMSGTKDSSGGENVNEKANNQLKGAESTQMSNTGSTSKTGETPAASTGESGGDLTVAGAITINIVNTSSIATFAKGTTITAGGAVSLKTSAGTNTIAFAKGESKTNNKVGIGAAVAINLTSITNRASTGGATVAANGIDLEATVPTSASSAVGASTSHRTRPSHPNGCG